MNDKLNRRKKFRLSIKIDKCDAIFKEGMGAGEIAIQELEYNLSDKEYKSNMFAKSLLDQMERLKDTIIKCSIEEVK